MACSSMSGPTLHLTSTTYKMHSEVLVCVMGGGGGGGEVERRRKILMEEVIQ